jgi:predicted regulator of Ras-like GTPase activity (Roadblock/LC7/MglB family)
VRPAQDLNWLVTAFADRVPSIAHALVVSSDGLPLAFSQGLPPDRVDQLAAVTSGLTSLVDGASRIFEGGTVTQTVVEMRHGLLIVMAVTGGSTIAVLADSDCDMGLVAYEMALLADRTWRALTPDPRQPSPLEGPTAISNGAIRPPPA